MKVYTQIQTPIGSLRAFSDGNNLIGLYFLDQKGIPSIDPSWQEDPNLPIFKSTQSQLNEYFMGQRHIFDITYQLNGTTFQKHVWQALKELPYGERISYKNLATRMGKPNSTRAVATALGRNPVIIINPCHRIIGHNGRPVGYVGGIKRKEQLLELEVKYK